MAKHLLVAAGGVGFLWLIVGLSPVQALSDLEIADKNVAISQDVDSYEKLDFHKRNLGNAISSELLIANENQKDLSSANQQQKSENVEFDFANNSSQSVIPKSANSSQPSFSIGGGIYIGFL